MGRFTIIGSRNDATGRMIHGDAAVDAAKEAGLEVYTCGWEDMYTAAYGRQFAVRTRHLKKLPRAIRKLIRGQ